MCHAGTLNCDVVLDILRFLSCINIIILFALRVLQLNEERHSTFRVVIFICHTPFHVTCRRCYARRRAVENAVPNCSDVSLLDFRDLQ